MEHKETFLKLFRSFAGSSSYRKTLRTFCLLLFLSISFSAYSQITVSLKDQPLRAALKKIEQVSNYKFFYNESLPDLNRKVSLDVQDTTIDETMQQLLDKTELSYKKEEKNVIVLVWKVVQDASSIKNISGVVVDEKGEPVIGASIAVEGTTLGTITNLNGEYTIANVSEKSNIIISFIGYQSVSFPADAKALTKVVLKEDTEMLDEIVVIGYGTTTVKSATGSISSVKANDLQSYPSTNFASALSGKMAGVQVSLPSGAPGGSPVMTRNSIIDSCGDAKVKTITAINVRAEYGNQLLVNM